MREDGLVGFVADGAVLPRAAGDSDQPLEEAVPFRAPDSMHTGWRLPSGREVTGLGIPRGVTVVVGGGYHGKSTLLRALERGVYPHIPGDGREWVATVPDAVTVRAEDGRSVTGTDISAFIADLPSGTPTTEFTTTNASGSTSQATGTCEALLGGASALLIDEDTSATNFMIRDEAMRALIPDDAEPITPYAERVRSLWERHGVSTVLVAGGSGAFFGPADHVVAMSRYQPEEVTGRAHEIAADATSPNTPAAPEGNAREDAPVPPMVSHRRAVPDSLRDATEGKPPRARGLGRIQVGREDIDVALLPQLVDPGQTQAVAALLPEIARRAARTPDASLEDLVNELVAELTDHGLDRVLGGRHTDLVLPRAHEVLAAVNRYRKLRVR